MLGCETARTLLEPQSAPDPTVDISLASDLTFAGFTLTDTSTEVDDVDLGGNAVVIGFRMQFDLN